MDLHMKVRALFLHFPYYDALHLVLQHHANTPPTAHTHATKK